MHDVQRSKACQAGCTRGIQGFISSATNNLNIIRVERMTGVLRLQSTIPLFWNWIHCVWQSLSCDDAPWLQCAFRVTENVTANFRENVKPHGSGTNDKGRGYAEAC